MKKIAIFILTLIIAFSSATVVFATNADNDITIYLVNPVSLVVHDETLLVADNVEKTQANEKSVIHFFDASTSQWLKKIDVVGEIKKISVFGDNLYVIQNNGYFVINLQDCSAGDFQTVENLIDIAEFNGGLYTLTKGTTYDRLRRVGASGAILNILTNANSMVVLDNTIFILDSASVFAVYPDNSNLYYNVESRHGLVVSNTQLFLFHRESGISSVAFNDDDNNPTASLTSAFSFANINNSITALCGDENGAFYLLADDNKITKFEKVENVYTSVANWGIGSDVYQATTPALSSFSQYTLCRAKTYPATIVYKTTGNNSVTDDSLDDWKNGNVKEFIVLDGSNSNSEYYFVLIGDKFGWIKKSGETLEQDDCIEIVNTTVSSNSTNVNAKLLNHTTLVYSLPILNDAYKSADTHPMNENVVLLQKFDNWYYVCFENSTFGFISTSAVKNVVVSANTQIEVIERKKISSISGPVNVFADEQLTIFATNDNGDAIRLESGTMVRVLQVFDNCSLVQLTDNQTYCYVANDYLVDTNEITQNVIIGLVLLFVALAISIVVVVIILDRKKRMTKNII